jgi:hypothetical protein
MLDNANGQNSGLQVHVAGLATIMINSAPENASTMKVLGYTQDGAYLGFQPFAQEVPGDENGGDAGPPIEKIWMGEVCQVQLDFTKWDAVEASVIAKRLREFGQLTAVNPTGRGARATAGQLMFQRAFCLGIDAPWQKLVFPVAIPDQPIQTNLGTKYARMSITFTCYRNSLANGGILYSESSPVAYIAP